MGRVESGDGGGKERIRGASRAEHCRSAVVLLLQLLLLLVPHSPICGMPAATATRPPPTPTCLPPSLRPHRTHQLVLVDEGKVPEGRGVCV